MSLANGIQWWHQPYQTGFRPVLPQVILDIVVRAYALVEIGGISGFGTSRGRNFEKAFYQLCDHHRVSLCERAGAKTIAGQRSASGFQHEVDAVTQSASCTTYWELKHLMANLDKNELLIFHGKALDFLQGGDQLLLHTPLQLFVLSANNLTPAARHFAVQWGIVIIEPSRLPLPLIYETVARGVPCALTEADRKAVRSELPWACRSLQSAIADLASRFQEPSQTARCIPIDRRSAGILDIQEQMGSDVMDGLDDQYPDWLDAVAEDTWMQLGGW